MDSDARDGEVAVWRTTLKELRRAGHLEILHAIIRDVVRPYDRFIRDHLRRGTPLTEKDWPALQLAQGKIQGLQDLATRLDAYAAADEEPAVRVAP